MRSLAISTLVLLASLSAAPARALVLDFDSLPAGHVLTNADLPPGFGVVVDNQRKGHPDQAIIFDTSCPPVGNPDHCTGGDEDLKTPGVGVTNDVAQNKMLVIAEDVVDTDPANGIVDDPDDEVAGGSVTFTFPAPSKLLSLRLIDIDVNEPETWIELLLPGGGVQIVPVAALGNNSGQTVVIPTPVPDVDGFRLVLDGSGAIDDVTLLSCGDDNVDQTEECDGTDDDACPGDCLSDCTCPSGTTTTSSTTTTVDTTTTTLGTTTTTVPPTTTTSSTTTTTSSESTTTTLPPTTTTSTTTTSTTVTTTTTTTTTIPVCGDNVVNQATEICDGTSAAACNGRSCLSDCTCVLCGNGTIEGNEVCDPPNVNGCNAECRLAACPTQTEVCNNLVDDDGDALIDCSDPDCPINLLPPCGCAVFREDPARIRFDAAGPGRDFFSIHGHFEVEGEVDLDAARFALLITNEQGQVYRGTLAAGELRRKIGGKGRYIFRDEAVKSGTGGDSDGLHRVGTRIVERNGSRYLHFRVKAYGDFSAATLPLMTTQIVADHAVGALTAEWRQTRNGWLLRQSFFEDYEREP